MSFFAFLLKNLLRRRARSILTILGVAVAIGTVVALRGISHGFESSFRENLEHRGVDLVVVAAGIPDQLRSDLDEAIGPRIAQIPGVRGVSSGLLELVDIDRGDSVVSALVNGWEPGAVQYDALEILEGRTLRKGDSRALLLGTTLAENLGRGVGDRVGVQRETFEVVGIFKSFDVFENGSAVVPLATLQELMARPGSVTGYTVQLEPSDEKDALVASVRRAIEALADDGGRPYGITAQPTREYVSGTIYIRLAKGMAWVTSAIALVIGGISVLNTMITAVMERTKEIGILRAIGWRPGRILRMVLGEAMLLTLAGAAVGVLGAVAVIAVLARVPQTSGFVSGTVSPRIFAEGLGLTLLMALLGGGGPAYRAVQMEPTEALRHE